MFGVIVLIFWSGLGLYDFLMRENRPTDFFEHLKMGPPFWIVLILKCFKDTDKKI